jgi:hypothetical protein
MSTLKNLLTRTMNASWIVFAALLMSAASAVASPGAIWTSRGDGTVVNGNVYDSKDDVYLNGGPQNDNGQGIPTEPLQYYFQVTDPSGAVLLSDDPIECRKVQVVSGVIAGNASGSCPHPNGVTNSANGSTPVKLMPYLDTPNTGGEYKVWLIPVKEYDLAACPANFGFCSGNTKTDNFKVRVSGTAYIVACKFEDQNGSAVQDQDEPMIASWPITATGVDGSPVEASTGLNGCVSFTVTTFSQSGTASVTLTETLLGGFIQRAPVDGSVARAGTSPAYTVTNGAVSSTDVRPGDTLTIFFGNQRQGETDPGRLLVSKDAFAAYKLTWNIDKLVNGVKTTTINASGTVNPTYTVTIGHDGGTAFVANGTINVSNPGSTVVAGVVTDSVDNGGTCTITITSDVFDNGDGSVSVFLGPGQSISVPYTCTYSSTPNPMVGTNTVTATWGTNGLDQNFATVDFTNATVVDDAVALSDTLKGAMGTLVFPLNPNPTVITYSDVPLTGTPGQCVDRPNTASFQSQTPNSAHAGISTATVRICSGLDLTVEKTASAAYKRTYAWNITKNVDQTSVNLSGSGSATFNYTVVVSQGDSTDSDWVVSGNITVRNPNVWTAVNVDVGDSVPGGTCVVNGGTTTVSVPAATNAGPGIRTVPYTCSFSSAPGTSVTNTATVTWSASTYGTPTGSASGTAGATFGAPTETDNLTINVTDAFGGGAPAALTPATLTASDTTPTTNTYTYSRTVEGVPGQCVTKNNTAAFASTDTTLTGSASKSVTVCTGADLTVSKTASVSFNRAYTWTIAKSVDQNRVNTIGESATFTYTVTATQGAPVDSGWAASGTITVVNPNQWGGPISVTLTDSVGSTGCVVNGGQSIVSVPQGGSVSVPYSCTFSASPGASITNSVTASWVGAAVPTPNVSATNTAGGTFGAPAQTTNQSITVTDTFDGNTTTLFTATASDTTPTVASRTYAQTVTAVAGSCVTKDNTAVMSSGETVLGQDSESVMVCKGADLTVAKQGTTSFTRTYRWNINKVVVGASNFVLGGTANYSVTVSQNGPPVDSAWTASGTITVSNPNDWAVVVTVTDPGCTVNGGTNVSVPADGSVNLNYSCSLSSGASFTNTATATWNATTAYTPNNNATGSNSNAFTTPTTVANQTVNVSDLFNGTVTQNLGSVTGNAEGTMSATFPYSNEVPPPESGCGPLYNVARIVETGQTSTAAVTNCNSGAHTIGFWQNKNGQGIIAADGSTEGACDVGAWLRGFAPFEDLNDGAACGSVVATNTKGNSVITTDVTNYVFSVIKVASAKGASMNAMLKAQMLATALNVYFSDPELGGSVLPDATLPIGGLSIDLTNIRGQDYSGFWGADSKTIRQLLDDAAAASNSGGNVWYGQTKSDQEKAKSTFDAINNEDVNAP